MSEYGPPPIEAFERIWTALERENLGGVGTAQVIEMMLARLATGRTDPVEQVYIIDALAKHAKQLILGPSMLAEGERKIR